MSKITDALLAEWGEEDRDYLEIRNLRNDFEHLVRHQTGDSGVGWNSYGKDGPFNWVHPRVAIGNDDYLIDPEIGDLLVAGGITHSLDCRRETWKAEAVPNHLIYFRNGTGDDGKLKDAEYFRRSIDYGLAALADPDAKLYVHCAAGINRGPSSGYAVLRAIGLTAPEAWDAIRKNRTCAAVEYAYDAEVALAELGYIERAYGS